jgi:hypothetical protein
MNNFFPEVIETRGSAGIELTSTIIVVHDGPHRLLSTSPLPSVPFSLQVDSYEISAIDPTLPSPESKALWV